MADGQSAGIVSIDQARYLASQYELDLVAISPRAQPPVVRLLDYNKFRYQLEKHSRVATKVKNPQLKEVRLSYSIDKHDLATKAKRAREFLAEGHFVRVFTNLRGRENIFAEKAKENLLKFQALVDSEVEQATTQVGKRVQLIIKRKLP